MNEQATLNTQVLDALLLDYATGALSHPLELLVETHLAMNEKSSRSMRTLMQLGSQTQGLMLITRRFQEKMKQWFIKPCRYRCLLFLKLRIQSILLAIFNNK